MAVIATIFKKCSIVRISPGVAIAQILVSLGFFFQATDCGNLSSFILEYLFISKQKYKNQYQKRFSSILNSFSNLERKKREFFKFKKSNQKQSYKMVFSNQEIADLYYILIFRYIYYVSFLKTWNFLSLFTRRKYPLKIPIIKYNYL